MSGDSSKRPRPQLGFDDEEPISTTRLATISVDDDVEEDAPTQRTVPGPEPSVQRSTPTLQSPVHPPALPGPVSLYPLEFAAERLHTTPTKLRAAFQRRARFLGIDLRVDSIVDLGGGVVGHKVGGKWFVRLPRR